MTSARPAAVKVGLIGYGYWGPNLARNLVEGPGLELAAIADARPERRALAARRHRWVRLYVDANDLIASDEIEALVIPTPLATHYPLARAAIERGKHVLVEKPLAGSRAEALDLAERADARGVRLMVDHTFVYNTAVRKIRSLVDAGDLGDLLYLDSVRVNLGIFQQDSNVIWDLAAHDLAILDHLIDERPVAISANGSALAGFKHENVAYIAVHYASGFLAHFHVNWLAPVKIRQMLLGGRQRMLLYDDMDQSDKVRVYDKGVDFDVLDEETRRQIFISYRAGDMNAPTLDRREALAAVVEEFAGAIAGRRAPLTDGAAGIRVVTMLEAADRSLRGEGRRITL